MKVRGWPTTLALAILTWCAGAVVFFRTSWMSGFNLVTGTRGDSQLILYVHEHLYRWLAGQTPFASPPIFYPQPNVLGYTDAFLLDLTPYSALRAAGVDPFLSLDLMAIGLSGLCFGAVVCIFVRHLRVRTSIALAAALLITFANNLYFKVHVGHTVFFALYWLPPIVLLGLIGLERFPRIGVGRLACVGLASTLYALLFATSYYAAWLFAFTCLIAGAGPALLRRREIVAFVRENRRAIIVCAAVAAPCFLVALIPFALIYAPVLSLFGGRDFKDYISQAPFLYDVVNVSRWNAPWGWLDVALLGPARAYTAEQSLAVTPILTLSAVAMAWLAMRRRPAGDAFAALFVPACAAVLVVGWLVTAKIGSVSVFWLVYQLVPGGRAIRAAERIQLIANAWVVAGVSVWLDRWIRDGGGVARQRGLIAGLVLAVCLAEQLNLFSDGFPRTAELRSLAATPGAPPQCRSFLIAAGPNGADQDEAMWISLQVGLPTLNGDSGWTPPGWRLGDRRADYAKAARQWMAQHGLDGVCLYDPAGRRWSPFPAGPPAPPAYASARPNSETRLVQARSAEAAS